MLLSSRSNDLVKHARRVREGKERDAIFLEGERLVRDALRSPLRLRHGFYLPDPSPALSPLIEAMRQQGIPLHPTTPDVLQSLSDTVHPQGLLVIAERPQLDPTAFFQQLPPAPLLVALDRVQDPGNLGTIARTAEAAGADGLLLVTGSADPFSPKALRAAMGSLLRLPVLAGLSSADLLQWAAQRGLRTVATCADATACHREFDWRGPLLLILGNEGAGIAPDLLAAAEEKVRIPIQASVESLNVSAAAAVLLFEASHQRQAGSSPA